MTKMTFRNHQYNVIQTGNMFIAITSYGGKRVRAVAKCAPGDTFDADLGAHWLWPVAHRRLRRFDCGICVDIRRPGLM